MKKSVRLFALSFAILLLFCVTATVSFAAGKTVGKTTAAATESQKQKEDSTLPDGFSAEDGRRTRESEGSYNEKELVASIAVGVGIAMVESAIGFAAMIVMIIFIVLNSNIKKKVRDYERFIYYRNNPFCAGPNPSCSGTPFDGGKRG